jgi:hypothetical protein
MAVCLLVFAGCNSILGNSNGVYVPGDGSAAGTGDSASPGIDGSSMDGANSLIEAGADGPLPDSAVPNDSGGSGRTPCVLGQATLGQCTLTF